MRSSKEDPRVRRPADLPVVGKEGLAMLAAVPLFAGLSSKQLKHVASLAQVKQATTGAMLVTAGAPGSTSFFVILEGTVDVVKGHRAVATLGAGEFFGELGVIDGGRRSASVVAASHVKALRLSRAAFRDVMTNEPGIALRVMESLVARVRETEEEARIPRGGR